MNSAPYTTQLQAGLGMIPETMELLRLWEPGMKASQLADKALENGVFARTTARRSRNIVAEMFAPRYMTQGSISAKRLQFLLENRFHPDSLIQLLFIQTARAQSIFADFLTDIYWPSYAAGALQISRTEAERFVHLALDTGKMAKRWADSTVRRVSGYLLGCCADFGLLSESSRNHRSIKRFFIRPDVSLYLIYDLHFAGLSDNRVVQSPDWQWFGMQSHDVIGTLKALSHDGHLLIQSSGDLVQISWTYKSEEDFLNALIKR